LRLRRRRAGAGQWAPPRLKKIQVFFAFFYFALCRASALGKGFADRIFAEGALPRAALGKGFAEGLRAESLGPSAKQPAPVVIETNNDLFSQTSILISPFMHV
jgi:hypothetical protein